MPASHSSATRRTRPWLYLASLTGAGVLTGAMLAILESRGLRLPPTIAGLIALGVGAASLVWSRGWWSSVDEAVREAHKTSWYWGGSVGIVIAGALAAMLLFDTSGASLDQFALVPGDGGLVLTGIVVTFVLQFAAYALFWAGWWLSRSR